MNLLPQKQRPHRKTTKSLYPAEQRLRIKNIFSRLMNSLSPACPSFAIPVRIITDHAIFQNGRTYYEYLVRSETGSSRSIAELQNLTNAQILSDLTVMQRVLTEDSLLWLIFRNLRHFQLTRYSYSPNLILKRFYPHYQTRLQRIFHHIHRFIHRLNTSRNPWKTT